MSTSVALSSSQQGVYFDSQVRNPADYHVVLTWTSLQIPGVWSTS